MPYEWRDKNKTEKVQVLIDKITLLTGSRNFPTFYSDASFTSIHQSGKRVDDAILKS